MVDRRDERPVPSQDADTSRRSFLSRLWLGLGGLAIAEYVWLMVEFLRPRPDPLEAAGVLVAGPVEQFELDSVTAFPAGRFYLTRLADGGFLAVSRECTHLGCTVPWMADEGRFVCPCHSSAYDIRGDVLSPPAPRALDLHPVRIENGIVKVDTGRTRKRRYFEASQVARV
ncbi:MAG: ubiquinol-cytochrome c reductase iron-sulfur subunit [Gemmatimonadetes bacterium]|nr:ubiquinol-cytochrome c reductase iron-sulfur subunit [Gemmatimonadota bacterium]MBT8477980.1 ubiquinol-cytochrome c reductase iron-sulfur subunit [Gemmatimonadota bacterium]NNK49594.1 ubiquinol-cytochrome c reductase iron-sulfur subunit [Gemmatimonadota bacterium]